MDDFLYIIIGIIWVAYSLYSNKQKQDKKRAMRETPSGEPQAEKPHVRTILEEILMGEMQMPATQQPSPSYEDIKSEISEPEYAPSYEAYSSQAAYESLDEIVDEVSPSYFENKYASRDLGELAERVSQNQLLAVEEESRHDLIEDFDIRKAVIYAEILNPRYI